jgi:hypothetical protein
MDKTTSVSLRKNILILLSVEMWSCFYTRIISNCLYKILLNKTVISFIRQELQNSRKAMKIHFQNCKASVAKIRNILLSFEYIRNENKHLNLNLIFIIVKYVSIYIRSFKRSKYFIRFFFWQTNIPSVFS